MLSGAAPGRSAISHKSPLFWAPLSLKQETPCKIAKLPLLFAGALSAPVACDYRRASRDALLLNCSRAFPPRHLRDVLRRLDSRVGAPHPRPHTDQPPQPPLRPSSAFSPGRNSGLPRAFSARPVVFTTCTQARSHQNPDPMRQGKGGEARPGGAPERRPLLRRGLRDGVCTLGQGHARVQGGPRQRRPPLFTLLTPPEHQTRPTTGPAARPR